MDNGGMDFTIIVLGDVIQCHNTPMTIAIVGTCNIICKLPKLITVNAEKWSVQWLARRNPCSHGFVYSFSLETPHPTTIFTRGLHYNIIEIN